MQELPRVVPRAAQTGHGGEQPPPEACHRAGHNAGGAEFILG